MKFISIDRARRADHENIWVEMVWIRYGRDMAKKLVEEAKK